MHPTAQSIYQNILRRAADEWGIETDDAEKSIGQNFDPLVRFLAGACAHELSGVYAHLNETELRLQDRISRLLLPEYLQHPRPAHALVTAAPYQHWVDIDETLSLLRKTDEDETFAFAPIQPTRLIEATLKVVVADGQILDLRKKMIPRLKSDLLKPDTFTTLWLGIETTVLPSDWQGVSLCFDLKNTIDSSEKTRFFQHLAQSKVWLNGQLVSVQAGLPHVEATMAQQLNGEERTRHRVRLAYQHRFITIWAAENMENILQQPTERCLRGHLAHYQLSETAVSAQLNQVDDKIKESVLTWLKIQLPTSVNVYDLAARLSIRFNVFPVVNRRLCGIHAGEHFFVQNNAIKCVHIQPDEPFAGIRVVRNESAHQQLTFRPFSQFRESSEPTYTVRYGGAGSRDNYRAWQRLAYLSGVLRDEYKQQEWIQKAGNALSLEEMHQLLGKKISTMDAQTEAFQDIYILLHAGFSGNGTRFRVEYWTCRGASANKILAQSDLTSNCSDLETNSIELVTTTEGGMDAPNELSRLETLRGMLLRRDRIVTKEDVKSLCRAELGAQIMGVVVRSAIGQDPRFQFGMTRLTEVVLTPNPNQEVENWESVCQRLQLMLEEQSCSTVPFKVRILGVSERKQI
jgi:hypothetical protein